MALAADFSLGILERRFSVETKTDQRRRTIVNRIVLAAIALIVLLTAYGAWRSSRSQSQSPASAGRVVVASKDFTESVLLAEIIAQMLEARGVAVERKFELGGNLPHDALVAGPNRSLSRIHRYGLHCDTETSAYH